MTLKQPELSPEDPRRFWQATDYDAERAGWYPPVPDPQEE